MSRGPCRGSSGTAAQAEIPLAEARAEDYDALIVAGGVGALQHLQHDPKLISLLKKAQEKGRVVAAIGRGRHCLANAGLFAGNFAYGPPVEVNGNIVAGRPPATTPGWTSRMFAQVVAELLRSRCPVTNETPG